MIGFPKDIYPERNRGFVVDTKIDIRDSEYKWSPTHNMYLWFRRNDYDELNYTKHTLE